MNQEEELKCCSNCQQPFPINKIDLHEAYCCRNIRKCKQCSMMIDSNYEAAHNNLHHNQQSCLFCDLKFQPTALQNHINNCSKRPINCKYCEKPFPFSDINKHEEGCESRTKQCEICRKYYKINTEVEHTAKCQQVRRNQSQNERRFQSNRIIRERMNSIEHLQKQYGINSPKMIPVKKQNSVKPQFFIEPESIKQLVDPMPISVRIAIQKQKQKNDKKFQN